MGRDGRRRCFWECVCTCGNIIEVQSSCLLRGSTQSCGCYQKEQTRNAHLKQNRFKLMEGYYTGYDSNDRSFMFDIEDYALVSDYCWSISIEKGRVSNVHAANKSIPRHPILLHQLVTGEKYIDHINHDPTDNRRHNLRKATPAQNAMNQSLSRYNQSGVSGVSWIRDRNMWYACISINNRSRSLGRYKNKQDAIRARLHAEKEYYGEFAPQRHLFEQYKI